MGKYLKKFETEAQYTAAESGLILPNVSLVTDNNNTVHYNPLNPTPPTHDYVEIGGIKWATMNIGANSVTDIGLYFQWADTQGYTASQVGSGEGQKYFSWTDYKYDEGGSDSAYGILTKYNDSDGLTTLQASDDAVTAAWGGNWRMPTTAEFQALGTATTSAWTADYQGSGVAGLVLTSNADSSKKLFFPASLTAYIGIIGVAYNNNYCSNTLHDDFDYAIAMSFTDELLNFDSYAQRSIGCPIRGVLGE